MPPSRSDDRETDAAIPCAVVSTNAEFVGALRSSPPFQSGAFRIEAEIQAPFPDITDDDLEDLRAVDPDVVILDLQSNLSIGLKFAQFLDDAGIGRVLLASAPPQSPELLMEVMHAGISDFIPQPISADEVEKTLGNARRKLGRAGQDEERAPGEVLVFFSAKGGTGCTTICTNTGVDVHRASRKKTLLLDLDLELGETALQLGEEPRFSMVDLVRNFHRVDSDLLASYIEHHESGVDLLSAPYQPADFEAVSGDRVTQVLSFLRRQYDYVFVDAPKTLNPATIAAVQEADHLMLVTTADLPSIRNLTRCLPLLTDVAGDRGDDWIRIVVNRYDPGGLISLDQVEETTGHPVYATVRNDYRTVMNAINEGTPAVMTGSSDFAEDIRELAGRLADVDVEPESRGGWLSGLMSVVRNGNGGSRAAGRQVRSDE